jgi:type II secretory pathway pseudopilin PulG
MTLVEILVVMLIIALLAGIVGPSLMNSARRVQIDAERRSIIAELADLPYRAYVKGEPLVLRPAGEDAERGKLPINVPAGWRIEVERAIAYNFNGLCSGGTLVLVDPDGGRQTLRLIAPRCQPES